MVTSFSKSVTIVSDRALISCYQLSQMRRTDIVTEIKSNAYVYSNSVVYFGTVFIMLIIQIIGKQFDLPFVQSSLDTVCRQSH